MGVMFLLIPLQHSQLIQDQRLGVCLQKYALAIAARLSTRNQGVLRLALHHGLGHLRQVQEFGRFPKRNRVLGRKAVSRREQKVAQASGMY